MKFIGAFALSIFGFTAMANMSTGFTAPRSTAPAVKLTRSMVSEGFTDATVQQIAAFRASTTTAGESKARSCNLVNEICAAETLDR